MDPVTGAIAGNIAGAAVGGLFGNKAAKYQGAADRHAVDQQMRPFNLKEPFLRDLYGGAQGAATPSDWRVYRPTYAGFDPMQMRGNGDGAFGDRALGLGSSFMDPPRVRPERQNIFDRAGGCTSTMRSTTHQVAHRHSR